MLVEYKCYSYIHKGRNRKYQIPLQHLCSQEDKNGIKLRIIAQMKH